MKISLKNSPWAVKLAAAIIALMMVANLPYVLPSIRQVIPLKVWIASGFFELLYLAIAYGLVRGKNWVRVVWSVWTVCGVIVGVMPTAAAISASKPFGIWAAAAYGIKLTTVALLFLPSSTEFFCGEKTPNQLPDPTSPSVTPAAGAGGAPSVAADH
jgi:hypothetical protein